MTATEYNHLVKHANYLYCILSESPVDKDLTDRQNEIDIIDCKTLEIVDTLTFGGKISEICFVDDILYIVIDDKLCIYDLENKILEELYTFPENTTIESSHMRNGHIYYNARYFPSQKDGKMWNIGYIIDFCTADKSVTETPLITDTKGNTA